MGDDDDDDLDHNQQMDAQHTQILTHGDVRLPLPFCPQ